MYEHFWIMRIYFIEWINVWGIICITKWLSFPVDSHQTMRNGCYLEFYLIEWFAIKPTTCCWSSVCSIFCSICFIYNRIHVTTICIWILYIIWEIAGGLNFDSNLKVKINFWISIQICKINQMIKCRNKWGFFSIYDSFDPSLIFPTKL